MTYGQPGPPPPPQYPQYNQPPSQGRGCFFYGCVTLIVLFVVGGLATFFGVRAVLRHAINTYTEAEPMELPALALTNEDIQAVQDRWDGFKNALDKGEATEPLVLSGDDINALLANDPDWKEFKGKAHVAIKDEAITGQVSIPLGEFPMLRGRYFNGAAELKVELVGGYLTVNLKSAEVKGQPLTGQMFEGFKQQNLAQDIYKNPDAMKKLARLASIKVKDGKIIVKPRAPGDIEAEEDDGDTSDQPVKSFKKDEEEAGSDAPAEEKKEEPAPEPQPATNP